MNSKYTAIITDVRFRMSLAIIRDLGELGVKIYAVEHDDSTPPLGFYSKYVTRKCMLGREHYLDELYSLCRENYNESGIKPALIMVNPKTSDFFLDEAVREKFSEVCGLCLADKQTLDLLNDKDALADFAEKLGVPVPHKYAEPFETAVFPCVVKPSCGEKFNLKAWDRYRIVNNKDELGSAVADFKSVCGGETPIVQEYIDGGGYGFSIFAKDGEILSSVAHKRIREYPVSGGPSTCCSAVSINELSDYVSRIVRELKFTGVAMFEFKKHRNGTYYLLESNPRVWGSFALTRVCDSDFSIRWFEECIKVGGHELKLEYSKEYRYAKMHFVLSDIAAGLTYIKSGQKMRGLGAFADIFNPSAFGGLFEWSDIRPSIAYLKGILSKRKYEHKD